MYPYIEILGREIPTYGLFSLVGILLGGWFAEHQATKHGEHPFYMIETLCVAAVGVLIGGHLLYAITNFRYIGKWSLIELFGGSVFYGGLFGGLAAGWWWVRRKGYRMNLYSDIIAMFMPLFHGFGRIGCFFGGCCFGIPSRFGILYHSPHIPESEVVTRFPVQLLESGLLFLLFAGIYLILYRPNGRLQQKVRGHLLEIYLATYAVIRFLDEFLRGDRIRGIWGPLSTSQWISLTILLVLAIRLMIRRGRTASDQVADSVSDPDQVADSGLADTIPENIQPIKNRPDGQ